MVMATCFDFIDWLSPAGLDGTVCKLLIRKHVSVNELVSLTAATLTYRSEFSGRSRFRLAQPTYEQDGDRNTDRLCRATVSAAARDSKK
jgi:hypothetical protein